jgi:hypothetical protein
MTWAIWAFTARLVIGTGLSGAVPPGGGGAILPGRTLRFLVWVVHATNFCYGFYRKARRVTLAP